MRILIAHNYYQFAGGEEAVVGDEIALLKRMGHEVELYARDNRTLSETNALSAAAQALWSRRTIREAGRLLASFQPHVLHLHNTFPLISPAILWANRRRAQPLAIVQTLHNYRLLCIEPLLTRQGQICEACIGKAPWRGVVHRCYRDSWSQSIVAAGTLQLHRWIGSYTRNVHRFIALTEFARQKFLASGFDPARVVVKSNFVAQDAVPAEACVRSGGIFVGRLSREKGLDVLARAVEAAGLSRFDVVGTGPDEERLRRYPQLNLVGWKSQEEVRALLGRAAFLVLPSTCYEGFPRTLLEAYSLGTPVIGSRLGPLCDLIKDGETGLLFEPRSVSDLAQKLTWAERNQKRLRQMGHNALEHYRRLYSPEQNYRRLLSIYAEAIGEAECRGEASSGEAS